MNKTLLILFSIFNIFIFSCRFNSEKIEATGTIEIIETNVSSKNNDQVRKLFISEGAFIKEGDLLAEIDHSILDLELIQTKANFEKAESDYARIKEIFSSGNTSLKEKEDAENKYIVAKAAYEITKKRLDNCFIKSPLEGVVTNKFVEEGEFVNIGSPLYSVSKTSIVNLTVYISEADLGKIKTGGAAEIKIDSYPKKKFYGKIVYISPNSEFTPKNIQTKDERIKQVFAVKIEIPNDEGIFKAGLPADAYLTANK